MKCRESYLVFRESKSVTPEEREKSLAFGCLVSDIRCLLLEKGRKRA